MERNGVRLALIPVSTMGDRNIPDRSRTEELIAALEREQSTTRDLSRRIAESIRDAQHRDKQVLIERRRHPR
jgi:hypothetical protein